MGEKKLNKMNDEINEFIFEKKEEYYDELIQEKGWEYFYHLSILRTAVLNWYDFREDSSVLEVGSGYGAITGLLCDKCKQVDVVEKSFVCAEAVRERYRKRTNLSIYTEEIEQFETNIKYDYIVAIDLIDSYDGNIADLINKFKGLLTEEGTLLFSIRNKFGLRYLCGAIDENIETPFDTVNGHAGYYSKVGVEKLLKKLSFVHVKFYYPLPDCFFTQAVYTDAYLPSGSIRDRVIFYYPNSDTLISTEENMIDEIVNMGAMPLVSNSYLVECTMGNPSEIIYAALSTDRGKENGFATVIYENETVKKMPLFSEGINTVDVAADNLLELKRRGICVVEQQIIKNSLIMPYIKKKSLANYLKDIIYQDKEEFINIFDRLYVDILNSSEHITPTKNVLERWGVKEDVLGAILKKAYIDMIPYNCFYDELRFIYYDQEFVREAFPAKYVLFRALRYTYFYVNEAEKNIPIQVLKDKFSLNELWDKFERVEAEFIENNRNYNLLKQFYQWVQVDKKEVHERCKKLKERFLPERESSSYVSSEAGDKRLEEVKEIKRQILLKFDEICKEYNIRYCAINGTLLGTVRHKGFIPWNDRIDLAMPRKEYERFVEISTLAIKFPYFLQIPENNYSYFNGGYGQLGMESELERGPIVINIFPLDYYSDNKFQAKIQINEITFYQRILLAKIYPKQMDKLWDVKPERISLYFLLAKIAGYGFLYKKLNGALKRCDKSSHLTILAKYYGKNERRPLYDKKDFAYAVRKPFENIMVPVPIGYKHCLQENIGKDFRIYPLKENRII